MWIDRLAEDEDLFDNPDVSDEEVVAVADKMIEKSKLNEVEAQLQKEFEDKKANHIPLVLSGGKVKSLPPKVKRAIGKYLHDLGYNKWYDSIPLKGIFDIMKQNGVVPLDDDGTYWDGMLIGGAECGSDGARSQEAHFNLAFRPLYGFFEKARESLHLSWCKMPSGKYEIVTYLG